MPHMCTAYHSVTPLRLAQIVIQMRDISCFVEIHAAFKLFYYFVTIIFIQLKVPYYGLFT